MKKYIIFLGPILLKNDGDFHQINARQLIRLYEVDPNDCIIINSRKDLLGLQGIFMPLYPKYDGNYELNNGLIKII
jgi:hypothetical protein